MRLFAIALAFEAALGVLAWALGAWWGVGPLESLTLDGLGLVLGVAGSGPALAALLLISRYPIGPLGGIKRLLREVIGPFLGRLTVPQTAMLSLWRGSPRRCFFAGCCCQWPSEPRRNGGGEALGEHGFGLLFSSVLFGLVHWLSPTYALITTLIGLYFGWMFLASGNLLVPVAAHAMHDFVALMYLRKLTPANSETADPQPNPVENTDCSQ